MNRKQLNRYIIHINVPKTVEWSEYMVSILSKDEVLESSRSEMSKPQKKRKK